MAPDRKGERLEGTLPSSNKGLLRLSEDVWFHYSQRESTVMLREVKENGRKPESFDVSAPAQLTKVLERISGAQFYAGWPHANASESRDRLSGRRHRSPIPQTRLRGLYQVLRDFQDSNVGPAMLENILRKKGKNLIRYFEESYEHFDQYSNPGENFGDGNNRKEEGTFGYAERMARSLQSAKRWSGEPEIGFDFLAREVNFRRTSGGAFFEDGTLAQSSGTGGVDLWLLAHDGGLPIVGEIKASADTNAFVALVQGLTYACELVTPAQLERVERHYPERFPPGHLTSSEGPHADIYLICEGQAALSEETRDLARHLLADRKSRLGRHIRRIVCLQSPPGGGPDDLVREWLVQ